MGGRGGGSSMKKKAGGGGIANKKNIDDVIQQIDNGKFAGEKARNFLHPDGNVFGTPEEGRMNTMANAVIAEQLMTDKKNYEDVRKSISNYKENKTSKTRDTAIKSINTHEDEVKHMMHYSSFVDEKASSSWGQKSPVNIMYQYEKWLKKKR